MFKPFGSMLKNVHWRFVHTTLVQLKGHAKWQNIKHVKALNDRMRQMMTLKQLRNLRIAAIEGGSSNPDLNSTLQNAIDEARRRDVPQATIQGYLKKLAETKDKSQLQRHVFEGRVYKKLNFIAVIYTDKLAHVRVQLATIYRKHLIETVNVKRFFNERGVFNVIARDGIDITNFDDQCLTDAIECGAEDVEVFNVDERKVTFFCNSHEYLKVRHKLSTIGHKIDHSECMFLPNTNCNLVQLNEAELKDYKRIKEKLTEIDGFDEIYDNLENDDDEDDA